MVRLIGALVLVVIGYTLAAVYRDGVASVQAGFLDVVSALPGGIRGALVGLTQVVAVVAPLALVVVLDVDETGEQRRVTHHVSTCASRDAHDIAWQ